MKSTIDLLRRIQDTERHIVRTAGTTTECDDYIVYRSTRHPNWYQANMIEVQRSDSRTLGDWESTFHEHFDRATYKHLMLYLPRSAACERLHHEIDSIVGGTDRGTPPLVVQRITWMFTSEAVNSDLPAGLEVRPVETASEHEDLIEFAIDEMSEEPWFTTRASARASLESRNEVLESVGVRWFRLSRTGEEPILAKLGMFEHGGLCRLQSVGTSKAFRRQGFGTAIVRFAINEACRRGLAGLALSTETKSGAYSMYAQAGLAPVGSDLWVMRYPLQDSGVQPEEAT